ncbi:MAG: CotS family spore coat protein [Clostridia bacterium]|nr:CotS family spore coat protein [Clostridia bacterium]
MDNKENLIKLADEVLKNYTISPENISVIQSGTIKTVWKVKAKEGMLCLKRLKHTYDKALFSVNAQNYIKESGGNVPSVIKDKRGQLIVQHKDQLFVLYEWLHGKNLNFSNSSDLQAALRGLAKFHICSKGYRAPENSRISSKLNKWPEQYDSMKTRLTDWKEISKNISLPYHNAYLKHIDSVIEICNLASDHLSTSDYVRLVSPESKSPVLCHQDFGNGNAILTEMGVYVIDLDGITYDLPARDLRKIIGKQAENRNQWSIENINNVIECYSGVNHMSDADTDLLYIDLLYPHWFFGLVKNLFQNNKPLKPSEIERIAKLEQSKVDLLVSLLKKTKVTSKQKKGFTSIPAKKEGSR